MNYELAAIIVFFGSLIGMGMILFRKIPQISELPDYDLPANTAPSINWYKKVTEKIKILNPFKPFSYEIFLQKILSKIRILTLKAENKTANWLQKLRERAQKKKIEENDNYWKELRKAKNKK